MEKLKIEYVPLERLKPNEYNPKKMTAKEAKDLERSIKEFGVVDPLIVNSATDREGIIIGGHQRYKIYQKLKYKKVPVVFLNIPDIEKEKELCLRLSKNIGSWDIDLLQNFDTEFLSDIGFEDYELKFSPVLVIEDNAVKKVGANYFDTVSANTSWFNIGEVSGKVRKEILQFIEAKIKEKLEILGEEITNIVILNEDIKKFKKDKSSAKEVSFSVGRITGKVKKEIVDKVVEKMRERDIETSKVLNSILDFIANEWR